MRAKPVVTEFSSGGRELAKWFALVLMTFDHVNTALFAREHQWAIDVSRVVFPIFAYALAYNLFHDYEALRVKRSLITMAVAGVIAQPFHVIAFGYWLPLNVLFTLALGVVCAQVLMQRQYFVAVVFFAVFGFVVDYQWWGVAVVITAAYATRERSWFALCMLVAALACLYVPNKSHWALAALPLLALFGRVSLSVPRNRWTFVTYYVGHLVVLAILVGV